MPINIGLIGCGRIAEKHVRTMATKGALRLTAVSDLREERMDDLIQMYHELSGYSHPISQHVDYEHLLTNPEIDAIVITTLSSLHAKIALDTLTMRKPLMIEKPLALSLNDAKQIMMLSQKENIPVIVCHQLRYRPIFYRIKQLLQAGTLGNILYGTISQRIYRDEQYYAAAAWRGSWEHDGGMLLNQGIHLIDLLLWFLGDPIEVYGQAIKSSHSFKQIEDGATALLKFSGKTSALIDTNVVSFPKNLEQSIQLFGDQGTIAIGGDFLNRIVRWHVDGISLAEANALLKDQTEHGYMYDDFVQMVGHGSKSLVDATEGSRAIVSIMAIYRSTVLQQPVSIEEACNSSLEFATKMGWNS